MSGRLSSCAVEAPPPGCAECPRLCDYREENRHSLPGGHNAPVPAFGSLDAALLVVGLAPGRKGANYTGRPFTGDYAGDLLYATLRELGLARGEYAARADDGLILEDVRITNAVRCVPPGNKPERAEIRNCNRYLAAEIAAMPNLRAILSLGRVSHEAVLTALGLKAGAFRFAHGAEHMLPAGARGGILLFDSYHCSRYNTQTRRLTPEMFRKAAGAFAACRAA